MAVELMAWNVRDGFGDAERSTELVEQVKLHAPDLAFFSEAVSEEKIQSEEFSHSLETFRTLGYVAAHSLYDDDDGRLDRHGALMLNRLSGARLRHSSVLRMHSRNALQWHYADPATNVVVRVAGAHLDDRREQRRLLQAVTLIESMKSSDSAAEETPQIIAGDLNAMHGHNAKARLLRAVKPLAELLPTSEPGQLTSRTARIGSLATRLCGMADGSTLDFIEQMGFTDIDFRHRPTKGFANLDHIFISAGLSSENFCVHDKHPYSDHRAISAKIVT